MSGANVSVQKNNGVVIVGDHTQHNTNNVCNTNTNNFFNISHYTCLCALGNHNHPDQATSFSPGRNIGHVLPSNVPIQYDNEQGLLSNVENHSNKVCLCLPVYERNDKTSALAKLVTDLIHNNGCGHFEMQLKVIAICKMCNGKRFDAATFTSNEFECTLPRYAEENKPPAQSETPFQAFLNKSKKIIRAEGDLIRINTKVCENGKKVKIKLRFDVRSSVKKKRPNSFSDFNCKNNLCPEFSRRSNSFGNKPNGSFTKSNTSLGAAQSAITLFDEILDVHESDEQSEKVRHSSRSAADKVLVEKDLPDVAEDSVDGECHGFDFSTLEDKEIFAMGKFGPLRKVLRDGQKQLVKTVITDTENETFLKEARQFCKCRHPYIRPTAEISEKNGRSFVFYWFLDGQSLFKALEDKTIKNYVVFCRILFGVVKGLAYLRRIGIECHFLTPEKILLDSHFNPRISGVCLAYFQNSKHAETHSGNFHRSLSYLDRSLRSSKERHSKNVLWSVGRCIWDMLVGSICREGGDTLLSTYDIINYLHMQESFLDQKIKTSLFSDKLRKVVYGAGWPKDSQITKSLVVCAVRCMLLDLEKRMSLEVLHDTLENELSELQKKVQFSLFDISNNLCLYCIRNNRDDLALTCGCVTACTDCLRENGELDCPEHGTQFSRIGHPLTYGIIIQGEFHEDQSVCENDSVAMESLFNDQNIFAVKNFERIKSQSQKEASNALKRIEEKIINDKKAKESEKYPSTLLLYVTGHCNDAGSLVLPDRTILKKKSLCDFISNINPKNLIVFANGHYSEKLVKSLSQVKTKARFFTSRKYFGVFSHGSNLCKVSHKDFSSKHSILVKLLLDTLKKNENTCTARKRYFTAAELTAEISKRTQEMFHKCLKPIDKDAGTTPIVYI